MSESDIVSGSVSGLGDELGIADLEPSARVSGNSNRERERQTHRDARRARLQSPAPSIESTEEVEESRDATTIENSPSHQVDKLA